MAGLAEVTRDVLVATHDFCTHTTTVVVGDEGGCLVVDPGITPAELADLAEALARRGLHVTAGLATHPHWDHVLWSRALGSAPRFATSAATASAAAGRVAGLAEARSVAPDVDGDLFAVLTPLPDGVRSVPWDGPRVDVVEHRAHAPGHAALVVAGVLVAGDLLSDLEVPLLDLDAADPLGDYMAALGLLSALVDEVRWVVPGHGHVGDAAELRRRLAADRRYLDELAAGRGDDDPRLTPGVAEDWLIRDHRNQQAAVAPP
ncbi:MBL fold metallo-hydrolase [Jiangella mangrovi]|uniref:Glyoxylase-like metal-dependent hydrolase (Beta-lactamase superfamily II) n=1 Tax=Jiangella mangrovi TaxID=1524084 RepID=A0A7W9LPV5_9ACTN|nr:MBL fold metallo-hydrolase [Jiangella mangrovi]MBB5791592.1 glyoxylase-like metal-dependent hydrolase (beta-lactamase superfamily II) [Jiangella mangrovi]